LHGDPGSLIGFSMTELKRIGLRRTGLGLTRLGSGRTQDPPTTSHRHVFRQGDFGWHDESQFHDRPLRERGLGV
jgi:hypothetical protein